jgi:hypothetical protein
MTTTRRNYELRGEDAPDFSRYGLQSVKIGREPDARSTSQSRSKKIAPAATLNLATLRASRNNALPGRVAERFKAPVLKTGVRESVPWVRIPPLPPVAIDFTAFSLFSWALRTN